eukprot:UN07102
MAAIYIITQYKNRNYVIISPTPDIGKAEHLMGEMPSNVYGNKKESGGKPDFSLSYPDDYLYNNNRSGIFRKYSKSVDVEAENAKLDEEEHQRRVASDT